MKKIAIHQSQYIPWVPYFKKIALADVFVVMDIVQYQKNGVQNRNMIRNKQGEFWLTIPVTGHLSDTILEKRVVGQVWRKKHWNSLMLSYSKAPYWHLYQDELRQLYETEYTTLFEVNQQFFRWMLKKLDITTTIVNMSELDFAGAKSELVLSICRNIKADVYLSGLGGKEYLDEDSFCQAGIKIDYLPVNTPVYTQFHGEFIKELSMLDMMFNVDISEVQSYFGK